MMTLEQAFILANQPVSSSSLEKPSPKSEGHPSLRLADELDDVFRDELFAPLFPPRGQPALAPWRLALVAILQFAEGLADQPAAHALRTRIDWKYVAGWS